MRINIKILQFIGIVVVGVFAGWGLLWFILVMSLITGLCL